MLSDFPSERLAQLRSSTETERAILLNALNHDCPIKPFPYGMSSSIAPIAAILGVSPGNGLGLSANATIGQAGGVPTFGDASGDFNFVDPRVYWPKVRDLGIYLVRRYETSLSEHDALSLVGHFNLGTGQYGTASETAIELPLVRWVSSAFHRRLGVKVIVTWGTKQLLQKSPSIAENWNHADGLRLDWRSPDQVKKFDKQTFRLWRAKRVDGSDIAVVLWPNHPSRPPFTGPPTTSAWVDAKSSLDQLLTSEGF